jgi:hypothetical protein
LKIKSIPIWFFACNSDSVVSPELCSINTYRRLIDAGAKNCHLSLSEEIRDRSNSFFDSDTKPYLYDGHWAWLEPLNNLASIKKMTFLAWLFSHFKG